jgi:uncharacterized protein YkwD
MRVRLVATLIAGAAVLVAAGSGTASGGAAMRLPSLEHQLLVAVNDARGGRGAAPLRSHPALTRAAIVHTRDMARYGMFSHDSADGTSVRRRVARYYARGLDPRRWNIAENIQWRTGPATAAALVSWWLESRRHRDNLLAGQFRDVGIAAFHTENARGHFGGRTVTLVTIVFGVR